MQDSIKPLLDLLTTKLPWLPILIKWIGALKFFFFFVGGAITKMAATKISDIVESSDSDDEHILEKILSSKIYIALRFLLLLFSLPLPSRADYEAAYQRKLNQAALLKKNLAAPAALAALLIFFFVGCASTPVKTISIDPARTASAIHAIVPPAVIITISQEPSVKPWLIDLRLAVCVLSDSGKFAPADLKAAIASTGIKEIQTPELQVAIEAVFGIYQAYYGDVVTAKLNQSAALTPILQAICQSLGEGLDK